MSTPQKCEYKSYQNTIWLPSTITGDFKDTDLEMSIIKTVFGLSGNLTAGSSSEYKYIINDYVLKDFTTIYVCAEVNTTAQGTTITKCYLVLPEHDSTKIIGYSAYRVNSENLILKLQSETGSTPLFVNCINGVAGEDTVDASSQTVKAPVLFGHAQITEDATPKECFVFPAKSSFLEGIHGNLYKKDEGMAREIEKYTPGGESNETYCYKVSYYKTD